MTTMRYSEYKKARFNMRIPAWMVGIRLTIVIFFIAVIGVLTGCSQNDGIVRKMAEIERLRQDCAKCERDLPGQCGFGEFMCGEAFK